MLNTILSTTSIIALVAGALWFIYSKNKELYFTLLQCAMYAYFVVSFCIISYLFGAKLTLTKANENPEYQLPEWFDIFTNFYMLITATIILLFVFMTYVFRNLKERQD